MLYINDRLMELDLDEALVMLSEQRREIAMRFKHDLGRRTCIAAYLLLCQALREEYGISEKPVFEYGEHGKPSIAGHPDIHFNLSHCREAAACYVSRRPVGIDIEAVRQVSPSLVSYTMNDEEQQLIAGSQQPDVEFMRLWTRKEALLKMTGHGIDNNLKDVLSTHPEADISTTVSDDGRYIYSVAKPITNNQYPITVKQ